MQNCFLNFKSHGIIQVDIYTFDLVQRYTKFPKGAEKQRPKWVDVHVRSLSEKLGNTWF